jgi:hypothetical protein
VDPFRVSGEDRAHFTDAVAERDGVIECLVREFIHVLGALGTGDAHLLERLHGRSMHAARLGARAEYVDFAFGETAHDALGHL